MRGAIRGPGNVHTATAYHPKNFEHVCRIPDGAAPWNSDYLLPNETFSLTLTVEGVYDYFCIPHEHAGMVGRIIVARPTAAGMPKVGGPSAGPNAQTIPEAAQRAFPAVEDILRHGIVRRT